ncbi:MAG: hypothetical protein HY741_29355 [Chloroflexi bacterium]|nr:hypothetical protein [Chloroflexota bacterium]
MESVLERIFQEFEMLEWFAFWLFLFVVPIGVFAGAIGALRRDAYHDRETGKGVALLSIGILLLVLIGLLLLTFGSRLVQLTVDSIGGWVIGLLIAGIICLVALPVSLVGGQLRSAFEYGRRGYWSRGNRALVVGMLGLLAIGVMGFMAYGANIVIGLGFAVLAVIALVLGWFGRFLVPEVVEEGREPLERPRSYRG